MLPPFERIGDPGWETQLRSHLEAFDVPLPVSWDSSFVDPCEDRLGVELPESYGMFLRTFGPIDFDYLQLRHPHRIESAVHLWFADKLSEDLNDFLIIANAGGEDDHVLIHLSNGHCVLAKHYPPKLHPCGASFDDLIRIACVSLYTSQYGWHDETLEQMSAEVMNEYFGFVL